MATVQSGMGEIYLFEDFTGAEIPNALTTHFENLGQFLVTGLNIDDGSAGIANEISGALNGVGRFKTFTTEQDSIFIRTGVIFDVGLMGSIVMECRIKSETLTNQQNWFGLVNIYGEDDTIEDHIVSTASGGTTIDALQASSMCGFLRSADLDATTEWHAIYKGGSTSGPSATSDVDLDVNMTAGEFQILRLEVDSNGTARWLIDGVLLKTLKGAVSTSTDMAMLLGLDNLTGTSAREMDCDYVWVRANRDWTV